MMLDAPDHLALDPRERTLALFDEVINAHDEAAISRFTERTHIAQTLRGLLHGFPDLRFDTDWMIAEGDRAVAFLEMTGTQEGPWLMVSEPTHRSLHANLLLTLQFDERGYVIDSWLGTNFIAMLAQLGWGVAPHGTAVPQPS